MGWSGEEGMRRGRRFVGIVKRPDGVNVDVEGSSALIR